MPPKMNRNPVVSIKSEELVLNCEWNDCEQVFDSMNTFTSHVTQHLSAHLTHDPTSNTEDFHCQWRDCNTDVEGETSSFLRHVYFHTFHGKIKCIGALLLEKTERRGCSYDTQSRNLIPELPERLECGWDSCHETYENAEMFYRHVEYHGDNFPEGNHVAGGCTCQWDGCNVKVKSKHKLKDHLRSHTQEKLVACPTCGALFSSRTKFFDHLSRQMATYTGKRYQCSHCNRTFSAERLLRDHMRNHVNQYKCPYCDMTSPSPSCLRLHIRYKHTEDKPFKCEMCDYSCKVVSDLRKHMDTHNENHIFNCQVPECPYTARGYQSLANHFKRVHQSMTTSSIANYQCHVCSAKFTRGALLTKHLKSKHKFNWPSGHSRFRYKLHGDGNWRLQTVRYESIELSSQNDQTGFQSTSGISMDQEPDSSSNDMLDLLEFTNATDIYIDNAEHVQINEEKSTEESVLASDAGKIQNDVVITEVGVKDSQSSVKSTEGNSSKKNRRSRKRSCKNSDGAKNSKTMKISENNNQEETDNLEDTESADADQEFNVVKISILTSSDGKYILQTEDSNLDDPITIPMPENKQFEENMYNLKMLGEVAVQKQIKDK